MRSWALELDARADRVRQLIGDAHWLSDGQHKETLVREFLRRYLPPELIVARGFVRSPALQNNCSPEVDILVIDSSAHPPLFAEGDLYIVAPVSVVAHVQVKTNFRKPELVSALLSICRTQIAISTYADPGPVGRSIYFFDIPESRDPESILKTTQEAIVEVVTTLRAEVGLFKADSSIVSPSSLLPTCIATVSSFSLFLTPDEGGAAKLKLFPTNDLSFACAFADLFSSIRRWCGNPKLGELDDMIEALDVSSPLISTIKL